MKYRMSVEGCICFELPVQLRVSLVLVFGLTQAVYGDNDINSSLFMNKLLKVPLCNDVLTDMFVMIVIYIGKKKLKID